ncbi:hypothetical protein POK33_37970 [Burkholderia cenocepacia]|uniref:hypothetical protein n=1 Tax=Burkholderia cenocepacia TaxID=95486 RepID=UPI0023B8A859|nr:hypothetical protein [Burkholderia cenocepacia]MDF0506544.1 hypothetical protein [Burkholderia cenocepacia]
MPKGRKIYGVFANTTWEGGDIVCSFDSEDDAKAFAQKCRDYDEKRPTIPDVDAPDADWDTFNKRNSNWEKRHPARPYYMRSYDVGPFPHHSKKD